MPIKLSNKFSSKNSVQEFNKGNRKMMPFMYFSTAEQNFNSSNKWKGDYKQGYYK